MRRSRVRLLIVVLLLGGAVSYRLLEGRPADTAHLEQDATGPRLRVAIVGRANDPRIAPAREAIAFWNREFARLGRHIHFDSAVVNVDSVPDDLLRGASGEAVLGRGPATNRLLSALSGNQSDIVIALSNTDLISFSVRWRDGSKGVAGIRRSDVLPLSLPNTVPNVIAHELGHVIGLDHNTDSTTLMCGRPANCRPAAFASDTPRFFPLTKSDEQRLQQRWP